MLQIGASEVIKGWDAGILGGSDVPAMKVRASQHTPKCSIFLPATCIVICHASIVPTYVLSSLHAE